MNKCILIGNFPKCPKTSKNEQKSSKPAPNCFGQSRSAEEKTRYPACSQKRTPRTANMRRNAEKQALSPSSLARRQADLVGCCPWSGEYLPNRQEKGPNSLCRKELRQNSWETPKSITLDGISTYANPPRKPQKLVIKGKKKVTI